MRPKMISRITIRLPQELECDAISASVQRSCSVNEIVVSALENELARLSTYRLNYYTHIRPLVRQHMGDIGGHPVGVADTKGNGGL